LEVVPSCWFSRASRGSSRKQNAPPEQVEAGVTIRLALDQFQSVDLPFGLAVAPGRGEGGAIMVRATALRSSAWRSMPLASPKAKKSIRHAMRDAVLDMRVLAGIPNHIPVA